MPTLKHGFPLKDLIGIMHGLIHGLEETPWIFPNTINSFETSLLPTAGRLGFGVGISHPEYMLIGL
jgi:hypothetical protein